MKKVTIIVVFFAGIFMCNAQDRPPDDFPLDYRSYSIRIAINDLIEFGATKEETFVAFGTDYTVSTAFTDFFGEETTHQYDDGLALIFGDVSFFYGDAYAYLPDTMFDFILTGSTYFITIGDDPIRIGSPIHTIQKAFPKSYKNRASGGTSIVIGSKSIIIETDGMDGIITRIWYHISS